MREPQECTSLDQVRQEIDRIDRQVIADLGRRLTAASPCSRRGRSDRGWYLEGVINRVG